MKKNSKELVWTSINEDGLLFRLIDISENFKIKEEKIIQIKDYFNHIDPISLFFRKDLLYLVYNKNFVCLNSKFYPIKKGLFMKNGEFSDIFYLGNYIVFISLFSEVIELYQITD